jgi:hypothetical protein
MKVREEKKAKAALGTDDSSSGGGR